MDSILAAAAPSRGEVAEPGNPVRAPAAQGLAWRQRLSSRAKADILRVFALVLAYGLLARQLDLSERVIAWLDAYEALQLDEIPLILLVLSVGLTWFAWRRIAEVSALLKANRTLAQTLLSTQEEERRALARELHDELGQLGTAVRLDIAYIAKVMQSDPQAAQSTLQGLDDKHRRMQELSRDLLTRLRPPQLDELGLRECLQDLCLRWQHRHAINCKLDLDAMTASLPDAVAIHLYRITQEALTNIAKHAMASAVHIELRAGAGLLRLSISDDGRGLKADEQGSGMGLLGMRERVECLQGQIRFEDLEPGLRICIQVPVPQTQA